MKRFKRILAFVLVFCMVAGLMPGMAEVQAATAKPADGTTTSQPFNSGTGGSSLFRIPAMVTTKDGTIVAAADARWNDKRDAGGIDTMVSYSKDQGATWNYTFANYLGDNDKVFNTSCATFIDPVLTYDEDSNTIYMVVDLYVGGYAINTAPSMPSTGSGFTSEGYLKVKKSGNTSYNYYVKGTTIYSTSGTAVSGYTVDEYFNLKDSNGNIVGNLFYSNSAYQAYPTTYLYMTKSIDNGKSWSAPQLLKNVKNDSEYFYGVGPGNGIVTKDGIIMIPCYVYGGSNDSQKASFIYSTDNGATWNRTADATSSIWSSESQLVELSDGTIRMFFRNGQSQVCYVDAKGNASTGYTWGSVVKTGLYSCSNTQMSAIKYSEKIDGQDAIIISYPASSSSTGNTQYDRTNGKIVVGLVNSDTNKTMNWKYNYAVNNTNYWYSSLTELGNGDIGLLYETGSEGTTIKYTSYAMDTLAKGAQIGESVVEPTPEPDVETKTVNVTLYEGQKTTLTDETGNYQNSYTESGLNKNIAEVTVTGEDATEGTGTVVIKKTSIEKGNKVILGDDKGNYMKRNGSSLEMTNDPDEATVWTIDKTYNYYFQDGEYYLAWYNYGYKLSPVTSRTYSYWTYTLNEGIYYPYSPNYAMYYDNGWGIRESKPVDDKCVYAFEVSKGSSNIPASTTIEITAKSEGNTSVKVGNTIYTINVLKIPEVVTMETTPFTSGTGEHVGSKVTKLTISTGANYDLNLSDEFANANGIWTVEDESIATVNENGIVTGVAEGTTYVICTIDDVVYRVPIVVVQLKDPGTNVCDLHITEIDDTTVTYSIDASLEFCESVEGEAIYLLFNDDISVIFFGDPDEGYALTFMAATNSAGQYYAIPDNITNLTQLGSAYTATTTGNGPIYATKNSFGKDTVDAMLWQAIENQNYGNDGFTGFSRHESTGKISSKMTFRSEKLPTVEKEVVGILGKSGLREDYREYKPGMTAVIGETVYFKVTVTKYASEQEIIYTNTKLTDNLSGATFYDSTSNVKNINNDITNDGKQAGTHEYYVKYTIKDADLDTTIKNTVDLNYTYQSQYSNGAFGGTANAEAKITATDFEAKDIVVDFGLPVNVKYEAWGHESVLLKTGKNVGKATYGQVNVSGNHDEGWLIEYVPTTILKDIDEVTVYGTNNAEYHFKVYPATTVYYEEGFAAFSNALGTTTGWSGGSKGTGSQETELLGNKSNVYGYTSKYAGETLGASNKTEAVSTAVSDDADFTFTGTGVDIYANCTTGTGRVSIMIKDASTGALKKLLMVETMTGNGDGNATGGQAVDSANLPIASVDLGEHGTYSVTIRHSKSSADETVLRPVKLDGFRVYNTLEDSTVFVNDKEDRPEFYQLRDMVLKALTVENVNNSEYGSIDKIAEQVYAGISGDDEQLAAILSDSSYENTNVQDLLDNGPKNELFLREGETLVFNVTTSRVLQLGMKAPVGETSYKVTGVSNIAKTGTITTSTDMFYNLGNAIGTEKEYTITVTNTGKNILSITDLKICDDPNATFTTLSVDDIELALNAMGYGYEPEYADASLNIVLNDASGNVLASTALTANGVVGEVNTFSAAAIEDAVAALVPAGYELKDAVYTDQEVAYGEEATVTFTAEDNQPKYADATLTVKLTDKKGNVIAEKALTANGLIGETHTFKSSEIKEAATSILPNGYKLRNVRYSNQKVVYGEEATVTFTAEGNKQEYADATLTVKLTDRRGNVIAEKALTANGVVGKTHTFKSNDIKKIATSILPNGYKLKNARYSNQKVAYGKSATVTFTVESSKNNNIR